MARSRDIGVFSNSRAIRPLAGSPVPTVRPRALRDDLAPALWLVLPSAILFVLLLVRLLDGDGGWYFQYIETENGLVENLTAVVLLPAVGLSWWLARRCLHARYFESSLWFLLIGAVSFAFFGEEISWGQQWIGWESPEFFQRYNRQKETNIHNLNIHLGRIAKSLLTVSVLLGGILLPWRARRPGSSLAWPTRVVMPTAVFVIGLRVVERCKTWFSLESMPLMDINLKEMQELYLALFFAVYVGSCFVRYRKAGFAGA